MPQESPEWSWSVPDSTAGSNPAGESPPRRRPAGEGSFGRAVGFTIAGTVLPGLGLIAARRRVIGGIVLAVFLSVLITIGIWAAVDLEGLASVAVRPALLHTLSAGLVVAGIVWVGVIVASHLALRRQPTRTQRLVGGALVAVLAFAVAAPMAVAARYSYDQASLVTRVFKSGQDTKSATRPTLGGDPAKGEAPDPWANQPRVNILLLGGDAGKGRIGTRTDTVILASIDTKTGDTTLFSLPRNTGRMPFPADSPLQNYYPYGFTNGDGNSPDYFLNAMYDTVPRQVPKNVLGETDNLGADALKLSVGAALGLTVDYYVLINLQGFEKLINALGGITVNINTYIPIGGNTDLGIPPDDYLEPGPNQKLNGREALWFARGRYGSDDYARMDRQRCVINAIIEQANPANMLARYESIAKAGKEIVITDMPREVLPLMVDLSLRVKDGNVRSVVFKHGVDGFLSPNPDFAAMRERVKTALGEAKSEPGNGSTSSSPRPSGGSSLSKKPSAGKTTESKPASDDVDSTCAFQPEVAATARPVR